jgi:hypothetical protein
VPVVLRIRGYRFSFYEADLDEPPHVHVKQGDCEAKFWLVPVSLAKSRGFREHELNEILKLVEEHRMAIIEVWNIQEARRGNR